MTRPIVRIRIETLQAPTGGAEAARAYAHAVAEALGAQLAQGGGAPVAGRRAAITVKASGQGTAPSATAAAIADAVRTGSGR